MNKQQGQRRAGGLPSCALWVVAVLIAGCASYPSNIQPGMSRDEVLARFGKPAVMEPGPGGERLVYATGPMGQLAFGVDLDRAGRVADVEQVLTLENFGRIQSGKWSERDVLWNFGPPADRRKFGDLWAWDYRYRQSDAYNALFTVTFDGAGLVARTENGPDWMFDNGGRNGHAGHTH